RYEKQVYNRKDNGSYLAWTSNNINQHNLFLQTEYKVNSFTFSCGLGYSLFKQKGRGDWVNHFEPALGIYYTSPANWKTSLAYSINTKYPTLHELFSASSGNPELLEESARKYELALDIPFILGTSAGSVSQKVFYNQVENLISKVSDLYINSDEIDSYGYELTFRIRYFWEHQIDYFLIKHTDKSDYTLLEVAENSVNLIEKFLLPFGFNFKYKGEWRDIRRTELEGFVLDPYWLHSVYLSRKFNNVKLLLGLENIFDENYMEKYGYPGEGFNFLISLETGLF
ncbi:hypothetical protein ACFLYK_01300, partial [Candidatus Cloacimonadota bacterium]